MKYLEDLPWCNVAPKVRCDGLRWSQMSLSTSDYEKYHCKNRATWRYTFLESYLCADRERRKTLNLCRSHLHSYIGMDEEARIKNWEKA